MKKIIAIVGKTNSGKDTVARYVKEQYGIPMICSYTTRPRRGYETNGVEHYFITKDEMQVIKNSETMLAYTINEKTGIEYCATLESMHEDVMVYIINPDGIRWLRENVPEIGLFAVYVETEEATLKDRAYNRGDDVEVLETRLSSERAEFDSYRDSSDWDKIIFNDGSREQLLCRVDKVMQIVNQRFLS